MNRGAMLAHGTLAKVHEAIYYGPPPTVEDLSLALVNVIQRLMTAEKQIQQLKTEQEKAA